MPPASLVWSYGTVSPAAFHLTEHLARQGEPGQGWRSSSSLRLLPLESQHVVCAAHSPAFPALQSRPLHLALVHRPRVAVEGATTLAEGDSLRLECQVDTCGEEVVFSWLVENTLLEEKSPVLEVARVGSELDGVRVVCRVEGRLGAGEGEASLEVLYGPRLVLEPWPVAGRAGEEVSLECGAEGRPAPGYAWVRLAGAGGEEVVGLATRLVVTLAPSTTGLYVCKVFVEGRPGLTSRPVTVSLVQEWTGGGAEGEQEERQSTMAAMLGLKGSQAQLVQQASETRGLTGNILQVSGQQNF